MNRSCPHHNVPLEQALVAGVEVDVCPVCYGLWFEEGELQSAKDEKKEDLRWLDIDLWADPERFRISPGRMLCPAHRLPLYEVRYGDSPIRVDVCSLDHGVWLDRGEFREIISYLRERADEEVLERYLSNLVQETWEVFSGPELLREELKDLAALLKLFQYKFAAQLPDLSRFLSYLPR